ncbi:ABC transporter ATP-binding protein [Stappia taiwanensis]|uniref:ABC transporter ATP-binding protein n=1 Tax=Stappia taiwanensis TaxID=992267 RepID=A0A838XVJ6_9HYPH|nr:dipeptide ABC transporter ATP-binding protein [Stappia taiwanensis]MBA4610870.1 ABC transporter ATP-binding protein [Stappia taiwanensis]GGE95229.1 ABC transporter ATP-binding protein [Stappia taiwanensis]
MTLLEARGLSLSIHGTPILRSVDLSIAPGETLGLVGESGSGKSMTALAAMQLLPEGAEARGSLHLTGSDLLSMPEPELCGLRGRRIGMVFQEPMTALNPVKTIGAQIAEGLIWHLRLSRSEAAERARALLDRVGLPAAGVGPERFPHQLSGGQRQRVVIALAIACDPELLIADEPTTALDVTIQAQILDLIRDIVETRQMGCLLISHDLAVVARMADRVAIMKAGEIVETGPTAHLFANLTHPYSQALLEATTHVPARAAEAPAGTSPQQPTPLLCVRDLVRCYAGRRRSLFRRPPPVTAVDRVSFDIHPGQSVGLVGESGCGKSTLARALLGLEAPDDGAISVLGQDPFSARGETREAVHRTVQVVFQDPYGSFNPRHQVGRIIAEPLHLLRREITPAEKRQRVLDALGEVGLSATDAGKYPHEFSGGQRQRIAIARALVTRPRLIIADEPVSALDVSIRAQILDLFADLRARLGLAYLFISHDLSVVRAITDEVMVMRGGQIVERGPTGAVFDHPRHPYTRELVAAAPSLDAALAARRADEAAGRAGSTPAPVGRR